VEVEGAVANCLIPVLFVFVLMTSHLAAAESTVTQSRQVKDSATSVKATKSVIDWHQVNQLPRLLKQGKLDSQDIPDPHWKDNACLACHTKNGKQASRNNLRPMRKGEACLNCHDAKFDHSYIHPVDIKTEIALSDTIAQEFKHALSKTGGKITCTTCHDLTLQCLPENRRAKGTNPKFFRAGPFKTRSEQCYYCHDAEEYQSINPHEQVDDNGNIRENRCRICHAGSISQLIEEKSINKVEFHAKDNLETMCWGCHRWTPHPGGQFTFFSNKKGPNHLKKPREDILRRLEQQSKVHNIILPLEPGTGRVYCATCHNPHEDGVIKNKDYISAASTTNRLRAKDICGFCHLQ